MGRTLFFQMGWKVERPTKRKFPLGPPSPPPPFFFAPENPAGMECYSPAPLLQQKECPPPQNFGAPYRPPPPWENWWWPTKGPPPKLKNSISPPSGVKEFWFWGPSPPFFWVFFFFWVGPGVPRFFFLFGVFFPRPIVLLRIQPWELPRPPHRPTPVAPPKGFFFVVEKSETIFSPNQTRNKA